jgi:hypothetical protein
MLLRNEFSKLVIKKCGLRRASKFTFVTFQCEKCTTIEFEMKIDMYNRRFKVLQQNLCKTCGRSGLCRDGGLKGTYNEDGTLKPNAGRFTTERVANLTVDEYKIYCEQRRIASSSHIEKLKNDPKYYEEHYKKVYSNSHIGYISRGQRELHSYLTEDFKLEQHIGGIRCDISSELSKVVIEYYGDIWHANPKLYELDEYIHLIRKTASEKWESDYQRNIKLKNLGYKVIIIWESEWQYCRNMVMDKIKPYLLNEWDYSWESDRANKNVRVYKSQTEYKVVPRYKLDDYLNDGWYLGKIEQMIRKLL